MEFLFDLVIVFPEKVTIIEIITCLWIIIMLVLVRYNSRLLFTVDPLKSFLIPFV